MISTNREVAPQPTVPIGAAWVAQALQLAGFTVNFLDLCFAKEPLKAVDSALRAFQPEGIALSVRNLDNCDFLSPASFLPQLKEITSFLKLRTDARLLLGGAAVSIMPGEVLEFLELDFAVAGEGERAAVEFFSRQDLETAPAIPGVVCRRKAAVRPTPTPCRQHPGSVTPQLHRWVDTRRYLGLEPVLPVQGKRGCANRCLYCTYRRIEGESWRLREPALVVEELIEAQRETGAREFEFVDSVFNQPEGYLEALLEEVLRRGLKVKLRASSLSPKGLTLAQVRLMERAGFSSLVITPETASDLTLAALRKDFTAQEIQRAARLLAGSRIKALWCFLVGGPREDEQTLAETIRFLNQGIPAKDSSFITSGIRIYPGTGMHELAIREGIVEETHDLLMPSFYFSPAITPQKARAMLHKDLSHLSRCIFPSDTRLASLGAFRKLGTLLRLPGPFWQYAGYLNRLNARRRLISREWGSLPAEKK